MIKFGIVANTHGIRGQLKILSNSDFKKQRLKKGNFLYLQDKFKANEPLKVEIESWSTNKTFEIIKLKDFNNINDVEKFKNYTILVEELSNDQLDEGEFLHEDLKQCQAIDQNQNVIGKITGVVNFGADDCLQIKASDGETKLIPFIDVFVKEINLENKTVEINVIEGLI